MEITLTAFVISAQHTGLGHDFEDDIGHLQPPSQHVQQQLSPHGTVLAVYTVALVMRLNTCLSALNTELTRAELLLSQWQANLNEGGIYDDSRKHHEPGNKHHPSEPLSHTHGSVAALARVPTVICGGCGGENTSLVGKTRMRHLYLARMLLLLLLPLPHRYLGSLCVSLDDVNLSSPRPQRRSLEASEHAAARLQVKDP